ncbi:hypothetical protein [Nitratireductor sp. GCM10026969]|uniref:hypothetical protein n=1 Tax=Nitratireductor sp. GCM10026969 TaxID=3252645 RepID=UPI0036178975
MSKLFIGHKPGVGGVVKVMANNADDALATPNTDYGKFLFNSETGEIAHLDHWEYAGWDGSASVGALTFYPGGSGPDECFKVISRSGGGGDLQTVWVYPNRIINRSYPVIAESRRAYPLGTEIEGPAARYWQTAEDEFGGRGGYNRAWMTYVTDLRSGIDGGHNYAEPVAMRLWPDKRRGSSIDYFRSDTTPSLFTVMDLPCYTQSIPAVPAGAPGTRNTLISPTLVRVGRGGVDADTVGRDGLIIDSTRVPMKVVRAGEVVVAASGSSDVLTPVELTDRTYMDYMVWRDGQALTIPQAITNDSIGDQFFKMSYVIYGDRVRIFNRGSQTLRVRYMICADDGRTTSGGVQVFRNLPSGHQQLKRPGSSDANPLSGDILLDTRFAYPSIVSSGYLHQDAFVESATSQAYGDRAKTVSFANPGDFYPFVKYYVRRQGGANGQVTEPWAAVLKSGISGIQKDIQCSDGTVALVTDTSVKFHLALGHPYRYRLDEGQIVPDHSNDDKPIGIHYYIFAIPKNL